MERIESTTLQSSEKHEAVTQQAFQAEVKLAGVSARLESRMQRCMELESQLEEMKAELENARELAATLRLQAEETGFDPLTAFMQMDQALDLAAKTAERFSGD